MKYRLEYVLLVDVEADTRHQALMLGRAAAKMTHEDLRSGWFMDTHPGINDCEVVTSALSCHELDEQGDPIL